MYPVELVDDRTRLLTQASGAGGVVVALLLPPSIHRYAMSPLISSGMQTPIMCHHMGWEEKFSETEEPAGIMMEYAQRLKAIFLLYCLTLKLIVLLT